MCEDISVEHPDRAGKLGRQTIFAFAVNGLIKNGKTLCLPRQCMTPLLEIVEELVISADIGRRGYWREDPE